MFWILELNFRRSSLHPYFLHFREGPLECHSSGRTSCAGKLMMIMTFAGSGPIVPVCIKVAGVLGTYGQGVRCWG